jgi:flavoprotein
VKVTFHWSSSLSKRAFDLGQRTQFLSKEAQERVIKFFELFENKLDEKGLDQIEDMIRQEENKQ